jgi:hypothetical protein
MTVVQRIAARLLAFGLAIVAPAMPSIAASTAPPACSTAAFQAIAPADMTIAFALRAEIGSAPRPDLAKAMCAPGPTIAAGHGGAAGSD